MTAVEYCFYRDAGRRGSQEPAIGVCGFGVSPILLVDAVRAGEAVLLEHVGGRLVVDHGACGDDLDIGLIEQIIGHQLRDLGTDTAFPVLFPQARPDADHVDMVPVIVEFRQSAELGRIILQEYPKEQVLLALKVLPVEILKQLVRFLAANTNYATMISGPQLHRTKLKFIQLSIVDEHQILAVIVSEGNAVRNKIIRMDHGLDHETVLRLNILLNTALNGLTIEQINLATISKLKEEAGIHSELVSRILDAVAEAISEEEEVPIYTSGATNFFKYPELSDSEKASELIGAFEDKHPLARLVGDGSGEGDEHGIQVYIGEETPVESMRDCSVVTATYDLGGGMVGKIGIVGPRRMDYDRVVGILKSLTRQLDELYRRDEEKG